MRQITVRGFDDELSSCIQRLAKQEGLSLNQVALKLLRKGAGLESGRDKNVVGDSLDHIIGVWSKEEAIEFDEAIKVFEIIEEEMWA